MARRKDKPAPGGRTPPPHRKSVEPGGGAGPDRRGPGSTAGGAPPRSGPSPGLDENKHTAEQKAAREAEALRTVVMPSLMATALKLDAYIGVKGYKIYLEQVLKDCGDPADPIERMLIEQAALAHFRIAQLHADAAHAKSPEVMKLYSTATTRLLGEFRRLALGLRDYRGTRQKRPELRIAQVG
jgi:hypothetical protein